ncbi:MAG: hypothetical protein ABI382_04900 [Nakamurella sp.]
MGMHRPFTGRPLALTAFTQRAFAATIATIVTMSLGVAGPQDPAHTEPNDRGDVPGWVMITMMTAIVVIVLLGVFQEAVVSAVRNAFDSITAQGGTPGSPAGTGVTP